MQKNKKIKAGVHWSEEPLGAVREIRAIAIDIITTRSRIIEAIWRAVVGNDVVTEEDGWLEILENRMTAHGSGNIYSFVYKGRNVVTLEEVVEFQQQPRYFLLTDDEEFMAGFMKEYTELAKEEMKNTVKMEYKATKDEPNGDATWNYDVIPERPCTVEEFVAAVLLQKPGEWGSFNINGKSYKYKHGKQEEALPEEVLGQRLQKVTARGGWSLMDYWLNV